MPVDDFAFARGATAAMSSKQEAEKVWEPKFIAEIASGKNPRVAPGRPTAGGQGSQEARASPQAFARRPQVALAHRDVRTRKPATGEGDAKDRPSDPI